MKKIITTSAILLVLSLAAVTPAAPQSRVELQMAAELRMLQEQTQQLAQALAQTTAQLTEALKVINGRIDQANMTSQKAFADQGLLIKNLGDDLSAIRERTQDTDTRLRSLSDEIAALQTTMTSLPSLLTQAAASAAPIDPLDPNAPPVPVAPPVVTPPAAASTAGLSPTRMLATAKNDYYSGQYSLAIDEFEALIKTFPQTEAAGEAQFWIGEAHTQERRWPQAINAYTQVIKNYPKSSYVPEAYYKRGSAQAQAGQLDAARASWESVIKLHPDSTSAQLAIQRLDGLRRQPAQTPSQRP